MIQKGSGWARFDGGVRKCSLNNDRLGSMNDQMRHNIEVSQSNLDMHQETKNISYKAINNILFAVGSGTFVLSINFLIGINAPLKWPALLIVSWGLLICSIVGNMMVHLFTIQQTVEQINLNNQWRTSNFAVDIEVMASNNPRLQEVAKWGNRISWIAISTLIVGIVCLTIFVSANFLAQNDSRRQKEIRDAVQSICVPQQDPKG